jgi:hypothetical protein
MDPEVQRDRAPVHDLRQSTLLIFPINSVQNDEGRAQLHWSTIYFPYNTKELLFIILIRSTYILIIRIIT